MMDVDKSNKEWEEAMIAKGHSPRYYDDGDGLVLNMFVVDHGFHNGPGCLVCGWSCCEHCTAIDDIPICKGQRGEDVT